MAHIGFKKLTKKLEDQGMNKKEAKATSAGIGNRKYGKGKMKEAAAKGKPLKESQAKKK